VAARASLTGNVQALRAAKTGIASAEEGVRQAAISGTGNPEVSAAQAQVTQALGALRAAQANLEKTILRSPLSGTLEILRVNEGQFIQAFTPVALVTSAGGLEVSIFIGERERDQFAVGEEVVIDGVASGTVVNIAPAIDPVTQKIEVKVATNAQDLVNGTTVRVTKPTQSEQRTENTSVRVPITALKFTNEAPAMFTVVDGVLTAIPVEIGEVSGSYVTILSGLDDSTKFVRDVRGKNVGQAVTVKEN
jgi:RND family efflux transporter MFP subunit